MINIPIPKPNPNEKEKDFISRCVSALAKTDPKMPNIQRVAICYNTWRKSKEKQEMARITAMEAKRKALKMSPSQFYAAPRDPPSTSALPIFDKAHVRNAMARWNQTHFRSAEEKAKAKRKIIARAKKFGINTRGFEGG